MKITADIITAIAWPGAIVFIVLYFRKNLNRILGNLNFQLENGLNVKWKDFEFKGVSIFVDSKGQNDYYTVVEADQVLFQKRTEAYARHKNLMLVHRAKRTDKTHAGSGLDIYELSVYLIGHKSYGKINDVKSVEYYFGQHFGIKEYPYGYKYIIENGSEGFAVKITAYGPTLCEARIKYHDGREATLNRYLDFEGTGYQFNAATNHFDSQKLREHL